MKTPINLQTICRCIAENVWLSYLRTAAHASEPLTAVCVATYSAEELRYIFALFPDLVRWTNAMGL